jgi:hypothetical protein
MQLSIGCFIFGKRLQYETGFSYAKIIRFLFEVAEREQRSDKGKHKS